MTGIGSKVAVSFLVLVGLFVFGVFLVGISPEWRVDSVRGTTVTCHERWHTNHTKAVQVTPSAAVVIGVNDKCPS
jgi:hypothetical protein